MKVVVTKNSEKRDERVGIKSTENDFKCGEHRIERATKTEL